MQHRQSCASRGCCAHALWRTSRHSRTFAGFQSLKPRFSKTQTYVTETVQVHCQGISHSPSAEGCLKRTRICSAIAFVQTIDAERTRIKIVLVVQRFNFEGSQKMVQGQPCCSGLPSLVNMDRVQIQKGGVAAAGCLGTTALGFRDFLLKGKASC